MIKMEISAKDTERSVVMKFQAKTYKRLGAMVGAIAGMFLMIIAVCAGKNMLGALLLLAAIVMGTVVGSGIEKKHSKK